MLIFLETPVFYWSLFILDILNGMGYNNYNLVSEVLYLNKKQRRRKILPYITLMLLCSLLIFVVNFELLSYSMNSSYYVDTEGNVVERGFDPLIGIFPRYKISYEYKDASFEHNKVLYSKYLFFGGISDTVNIKVNKGSPDDFILPLKFFDSPLNIVSLCVILFCLVILVLNIRRDIKSDEKKAVKQEV